MKKKKHEIHCQSTKRDLKVQKPHQKLTTLGGNGLVLVNQKVFGRFGADGQSDQLEDGRQGGQGEEDWPQIYRAEDRLQTQDL